MPKDLEDQLDAALDKAFPSTKPKRISVLSNTAKLRKQVDAYFRIINQQSGAIESLKSEKSALVLALSLAVYELDRYGFPQRSVNAENQFNLMKSLLEPTGA